MKLFECTLGFSDFVLLSKHCSGWGTGVQYLCAEPERQRPLRRSSQPPSSGGSPTEHHPA